ncbi:MAG: helix-turn-helix transcriptional regulator [Lachnospiraceae bacterium]|nr:helix-turn-helix transcriptional regulator [Lachnospiraceae bacterium]
MQNAKFNRKVLDSGKTLYRICKETGIPYTTLSELATGKKAINTIAAETVYKLCVYFVCDVKDILNDVNCGNNVSGNYRGYRYLWKNEDSGPSLYISKGDVIVETKTYEQIYAKRPFQIMVACAELQIDEHIRKEKVNQFYEENTGAL